MLCRQNFLVGFYNFPKTFWGLNPFKCTSYNHHQPLQHHQHLQHPQHQQEKHRPTSLYLFQTMAVSDENSSFWDRSGEYLFVQNFFELLSPTKHCSPFERMVIPHHVSCVMCHLSLSPVKCRLSPVTRHMFFLLFSSSL